MPHILLNNQPKPISNIICIGRNYVKHINELKNETPSEPLVFFKPTSTLHFEGSPIQLPEYSTDIHYETELVLYIGKSGKDIPEDEAYDYIAGYGLGLDLTARDIQDQEKAKGLPWSKSKCFPHAACLTEFVGKEKIANPNNIEFNLHINSDLRQTGNTQNMIFPIATIVSYLSQIYGLMQGDIIYTGTPEGVGKLNSHDHLELNLSKNITASFDVK